MGNADDAPEEVPVRSESASSRLPPQLNRLPVDKLTKVHEALEELKAAGLTDVKDLGALSQCVKDNTNAAGNARLPSEDLTSEYMGGNLWAWTPKRWFDSIQAQGAPLGTKSEEVGNGNEASEDQLPPLPKKLQERFDHQLARISVDEPPNFVLNTYSRSSMVEPERGYIRKDMKPAVDEFKAWFENMMKNDAEIRSFASMDRESLQAQKGDGAGCLFDFTKTAPSGFKPLGKLPLSVMSYGVSAPFTANIGSRKSNVAPSLICLHLGGEGSDVGTACWKRLMDEHLLDASGRPTEGAFFGCSTPFFAESTTGRYVPRAVFAGYGAARMESVSKAGLFAPTSVLVGGNEYSYFKSGEEDNAFSSEVMDCIRRQMERADFVEGFLMTHGSGEDLPTSGFTCKMLTELSVQYGKTAKMTFTGVPDLQGNDQLPLAASALLSRSLLEYTDLVNFYDHAALPSVAKPGEQPSSVISRVFSGVTGPMRFGRSVTAWQGSRLASLWSIQVNLVCHPRIHFALPGISCGSMEDGGYAAAAAALSTPLCSVEKGKTIAMTIHGRGAEQSCLISRVAAYKLSKEYDFVDYCPTGFAISSFKDAKCEQAEITVLQNTTAASKVFGKFSDGLDNCRGEELLGGHEEGIISEALEDMSALIKDYEEIAEAYKPEEYDEEEEEEEEE